MINFSEDQLNEIEEIIQFIKLYQKDGFNRLKIWKELRDSNINSDLILAAFRKIGIL